MSDGLVIVGGSCAAVQIAAAARRAGYAEPIRMISEEDALPYQRPPLSKAFLLGTAGERDLPLRGEPFYRDQRIDLELGARAEAVDLRSREVVTAQGRRLRFERLALAVGARARKLDVPGADHAGVFTLRDLSDAVRLKAALADAESVAVVGGGFIGLEVAASAAKLGKRVTVLEAQDRLLGRTCSPLLADWFRDLHVGHGTSVMTGVNVAALRGSGGCVRWVELADGRKVAADLVVVGVGVAPNDELAALAGIDCGDGIVVDRFAKTSNPIVVAAGDCTRFPCAFSDGLRRIESIQNATDQARAAAAAVLGRDEPHRSLPWFWSDQYDAKLQMAGLSQEHDAHVVRGSPASGRFSVFYYRRRMLIAVDSVSCPAEHMIVRKLIAGRLSPTPAQASDVGFDLTSLLPAGPSATGHVPSG